jgi:hypothetical protein
MRDINVKMLLLLTLLAGMLLVLPYTIRMINGNPYIINSESYYTLRIYQQEKMTNYDALQDRVLPLNIIQAIPHTNLMSIILTRILPFILGMAVIMLGFLILHKYNISERNIYAILLLLIVSPIFLYIFTDFNPYSITIFLTLLSLYLMLKKQYLISITPLIFIPFIEIYSAIIVSIFMMIYFIVNRKNVKNWKIILPILAASLTLSIISNTLSGYNLLQNFAIQKSNIITDIGANIGYSFSALVLSLIGLVILWDKGWKNLIIYSSILLSLVISVFNSTVRIYLNFILVVYGGFALIYLMKRKWSIQLIKKVTMLLIICSIFFTTVLYVTQLVKSSPDANYVDALLFIKKQALPEEKILSSEENGYMIEYYSGMSAFIDGHTSQDNPSSISVAENILSSRNLGNTESMLEANNIKYIFIDNAYMQYVEEKQGLLFLIDTSKKFTNIYQNDKITVWMYLGKGQPI